MGVLEVSRSIGDGPYKNHGVTCLPDIKRCQLTSSDRYIKMTSNCFCMSLKYSFCCFFFFLECCALMDMHFFEKDEFLLL